MRRLEVFEARRRRALWFLMVTRRWGEGWGFYVRRELEEERRWWGWLWVWIEEEEEEVWEILREEEEEEEAAEEE